jgi:hypothetical protein
MVSPWTITISPTFTIFGCSLAFPTEAADRVDTTTSAFGAEGFAELRARFASKLQPPPWYAEQPLSLVLSDPPGCLRNTTWHRSPFASKIKLSEAPWTLPDACSDPVHPGPLALRSIGYVPSAWMGPTSTLTTLPSPGPSYAPVKEAPASLASRYVATVWFGPFEVARLVGESSFEHDESVSTIAAVAQRRTRQDVLKECALISVEHGRWAGPLCSRLALRIDVILGEKFLITIPDKACSRPSSDPALYRSRTGPT